MKGKVVINTNALMEISQIANEKLAKPIAERVAQQAGSGHEVRTTDRTSPEGWARTRVITTDLKAMEREARYGSLTRAFGDAQ